MEGEGDVVLDCLAFLVQTPATTNRRKKALQHTPGGGKTRKGPTQLETTQTRHSNYTREQTKKKNNPTNTKTDDKNILYALKSVDHKEITTYGYH